jgi:hypothetical protein
MAYRRGDLVRSVCRPFVCRASHVDVTTELGRNPVVSPRHAAPTCCAPRRHYLLNRALVQQNPGGGIVICGGGSCKELVSPQAGMSMSAAPPPRSGLRTVAGAAERTTLRIATRTSVKCYSRGVSRLAAASQVRQWPAQCPRPPLGPPSRASAQQHASLQEVEFIPAAELPGAPSTSGRRPAPLEAGGRAEPLEPLAFHPDYYDASGRLMLKNLTLPELEAWCLSIGERPVGSAARPREGRAAQRRPPPPLTGEDRRP